MRVLTTHRDPDSTTLIPSSFSRAYFWRALTFGNALTFGQTVVALKNYAYFWITPTFGTLRYINKYGGYLIFIILNLIILIFKATGKKNWELCFILSKVEISAGVITAGVCDYIRLFTFGSPHPIRICKRQLIMHPGRGANSIGTSNCWSHIRT